jgi:hypothetical protein
MTPDLMPDDVVQRRLGTTRGYNREKHKEVLNILPLPPGGVWVAHRTTVIRIVRLEVGAPSGRCPE